MVEFGRGAFGKVSKSSFVSTGLVAPSSTSLMSEGRNQLFMLYTRVKSRIKLGTLINKFFGKCIHFKKTANYKTIFFNPN
jgi:hypothetical protein